MSGLRGRGRVVEIEAVFLSFDYIGTNILGYVLIRRETDREREVQGIRGLVDGGMMDSGWLVV